MQPELPLRFGRYSFHLHTRQLWRGKQEVKLTGKAVAVLRSLLIRPGQVVTKDDLFTAVWADTVVSDAALTSCIQELREALHDNARKPRFIETVYRRGFRFFPAVTTQPVQGSTLKVQGSDSEPRTPNSELSLASSLQSQASTIVGRAPDLAFLHERLAKALHGERQIVFVTGEPGIGKTTLLNVFRQRLAAGGWRLAPSPQASSRKPLASPMSFAHGQCIEHYGAGEAYLPILEALGRLCREPGGERLIELLSQYASTWLVQMPALLSTTELEELQRRTAGVTRERMLRELAEALEVVTAECPLMLVLEDLHWSDVSTLDLLSMLARRQEPARLLIIGTYRPVEVLTRDHPLKGIKQELQLHGQCEELALDFLSEADVAEYLAQRFDVGAHGRAPLQALTRYVYQRTDGNPLFMVNVTNELVAREVVTKRDGQWATKVGGGLTQHLADLAEVCKKAGQPEDGLSALIEALTLVDRLEERWYEAELYRLKGELILQRLKVQGLKFKVQKSPESEAEEYFLKAIEVAQKQQAKSWELRATTSLARLWQSQGEKKQAHRMLSEIYAWFTEGFDTKDLQEAQALIEELA